MRNPFTRSKTTADAGAGRADAATRLPTAARLSAALPPLLVEAERVAASVAPGVHGRRRVGSGDSFWQFRRYQAGDTLQRIDWRQTAKRDAVFVRELEWEASQTVWLWRDASPSMDYRSHRDLPTKRARAEVLLMALAALLGRGGEKVVLLGAQEATPGSGRASLERIAHALARGGEAEKTGEAGKTGEADTGGDSVPGEAPVPRHGEMVVLGDFLAEPEALDRMFGYFADRGVRGHLLQILDPAEAALPFDGRVRFEGVEGEQPMMVPRVEGLRDAYLGRLRALQDMLGQRARRAGWTFSVHHTDHQPHLALLALYGALAGDAVAGGAQPTGALAGDAVTGAAQPTGAVGPPAD